MNPNGGDEVPAPEEPNFGEPVRLLLEQEREPSSDFLGRIRRRIHRRSATSQFAAFSWHLPKAVLLEMINVFGHIFSALDGRRRDSKS
jgi:hypothetical protein